MHATRLLTAPLPLLLLAPSAARSAEPPSPPLASARAAPAGPPTLDLYIFGETKEPLDKGEADRLKKELGRRRSEAAQARKDLEKELKRKYGKADWPQEASERYQRADRRERLATLEYHKVEAKPSEVPDSVDNMKGSMAHVVKSTSSDAAGPVPRLVESRDQASVSIEVLTRRSKLGPSWFLYLKVTPERWLDPARLGGVSLDSSVDLTRSTGGYGVVRTLTDYGEEGPYWLVEVERIAGAAGWKGVAGLAVERLVETLRAAAANDGAE